MSSESKKVELVLTKVNQLRNLYRDEFGKLDRQGLHLESIQKNYYRPDDDQELKLLKMKNLNFMRGKHRWYRIPTVKFKIPGKAFLKSESRTSVTFKL